MFEDCEIVYTETMHERKRTMEEICDGFVMMPGGIGTLDEFFETLTLKELGRNKKPIAVYNVNNYFDHLSVMLEDAVRQGFTSAECVKNCFVSENPDAVLRYIETWDTTTYDKYHFTDES
jgi:uncharacterized protein (TIGR00730 family)